MKPYREELDDGSYNPNAKWDWYLEEKGFWRDVNGNPIGRAKRKDFSIEQTEKAHRESRKKWYRLVKEKHPENLGLVCGEAPDYNEPTEEEYANQPVKFSPVGFLDDEWHDDEEENYEELFNKWWEELAPDTEITILNCHI